MTTDTDKLVDWLDSTCHFIVTSPREKLWELHADQLAAFADAHVASLCADVEPVAWLVEWEYLAVQEWRGGQKTARETWVKRSTVVDAVAEANAFTPEEKVWRNKKVSTLYPASVVASITAQRDQALARVAELEKDAARYRWLRSVPNAFKAQRIVNDTPHGMDATIDAAMNGGNQ